MKKTENKPPPTLPKARTGVDGPDEIIGGGLPKKRPTLLAEEEK